jgi:hypothetical protein
VPRDKQLGYKTIKKCKDIMTTKIRTKVAFVEKEEVVLRIGLTEELWGSWQSSLSNSLKWAYLIFIR